MKSEKRSVFVEFRVANALHDHQIIFNLFKMLCVISWLRGRFSRAHGVIKYHPDKITFFMSGQKHNKT